MVVAVILGTVGLMAGAMWIGGGRDALRKQLPRLGVFTVAVSVWVGGLALLAGIIDSRVATVIAGLASLAVIGWVVRRRTFSLWIAIPIGLLIVVSVSLLFIGR